MTEGSAKSLLDMMQEPEAGTGESSDDEDYCPESCTERNDVAYEEKEDPATDAKAKSQIPMQVFLTLKVTDMSFLGALFNVN